MAASGDGIGGNDPGRRRLSALQLPPNLFSIAFGLVGLGEMWAAAGPVLSVEQAVANGIFAFAAAVWLVLITGYLLQGPRYLLADFRHPVLGPFMSLALIVPMAASARLATADLTAARILVSCFLALTMLFGGLITGQWIVQGLDQQSVHPGYFLPTVAGGLVGAGAAAQVHLDGVAQASFGVGIICWLLLGSTILNRTFFRPVLPPAVVPTMAIELAPPAVAGVAYFALTGGATTAIAYGLAGYAILMLILQARFVPLYRRLRFSPGFWAFAFSYAIAGTDALLWIAIKRPTGSRAYAIAIVAVITAFVVALSARTVLAVVRGQLLPARQSATKEKD
jgi:tellurite resistance protein